MLPLLVNPRAGAARMPVDAIVATLESAGARPRLVAAEADLDEALRAIVAEGAPLVAIAGGDGTLRTAARVLAWSGTGLLAIPTGTLNHFSRSIGIDSIEAAAAAAVHGRTVRIPVGYMEAEPFLNTATFGLYADVVRRRERLRAVLGRWPAALLAFAAAVAMYRPLRVTLRIDGEELERATALVAVGIGHRSFPVTDVPSRLDATSELVLSILRARTRLGLLLSGVRTGRTLLSGRMRGEERDVELLIARAFVLESGSRRLGLTLDGEIVDARGRVRVAIREAALQVRVPPSG